MTISAAIATFNEEKNIQKCLESITDWVNEIVIVDGSSSDRTREIASKFTKKIIKTSNPEIFHLNKQKAIDACISDWIIQLDADEVVGSNLKNEIIKTINSHNPESGYWIPRRNYFLGRFLTKGGQYPDYSLRLYKRGKGRLPCKNVHEQAQVEGKTGYLQNPLLHFPYPNFSHYMEHFDRYTTIVAQELKTEKLKINFLSLFSYLIGKPSYWFILTYFRHKGFLDLFPGFVFSLFSSLRFPVAFVKYYKNKKG